MNKAIIVQARMTSTRLPGKVLKRVLGKPLLEYQIERLKRVEHADLIIIATTTNGTDDPVAALTHDLGVQLFRGSEDDVLSRYYGAAEAFSADIVIRITADCPLLDPKIVDSVIAFYLGHAADYDYVSNTLSRTYPQGMDTEVFSARVLREAFQEASTPVEREHVTPFMYGHPDRYRLGSVTSGEDHSFYRWTVDTPEDFELIRRIITELYPRKPHFEMQDILTLLQQHPEWSEINAHIRQKKLGE